jgi:Tc5 transposase DNA-binding domain
MMRQKSEKTAETDAKVEAAKEGLSKGLYSTPYAAAKALQLSQKTLYWRLAGGKSHAEGKENQQNLTHAEEEALVRWITQLTATGHPARHCFIKEIAEEIRRQRHTHSTVPMVYPSLGDLWVPQFLSRYSNLQATLLHTIDSARIKEVSSEAVLKFFEVFCSLLKEHQIPLQNIYNMDETGL